MICAHCKAEFIPGARFCAECGRLDTGAPSLAVPAAATPAATTMVADRAVRTTAMPVASYAEDDDDEGYLEEGDEDGSYEPRAIGVSPMPRWLIMVMWGAVGGLLAIPVTWLAGKGVTEWSKNMEPDQFEFILRVSFGVIGASFGLSIATGVAIGRAHAGERFNPMTIVVGALVVGGTYAAWDTVLIGSNKADVVVKAIGLGAVVGAGTTLSLGGAVLCAILFGAAEQLSEVGTLFDAALGQTAGDVVRSYATLGAIGAVCAFGASLPAGGLLPWSPLPGVKRVSAGAMALVATIALGGAAAVTAKSVADVNDAQESLSASLDSQLDFDEDDDSSSDYSSYSTTTYRSYTSFTPTQTYSVTVTKAGGDAVKVSLALDHFYAIDEAPGISDAESPEDGSCSIDGQRDLAAPMKLTVTNANTEFAQEIGAKFFARDRGVSYGSSSRLNAEVWYTDGGRCSDFDGSSPLSVISTESLEPGRSVVLEGYFILRGVRSPAYPEGDPNVFDDIDVLPLFYADSDGRAKTASNWSANWSFSGQGSNATYFIPLTRLRDG